MVDALALLPSRPEGSLIRMALYVALLHSIVLGAGRRVVMSDLKAMAEGLGFRNARTLVATGNLVFEAEEQSIVSVEEQRSPDRFRSQGQRDEMLPALTT